MPFVSNSASTTEMIAAVNEAEKSNNNLCIGGSYDGGQTFEALINSKNIKKEKTKLAILIKYGTEEQRQMEELSEEMAGKLDVYKLDVDEAPKMAEKYEIQSIPHLIIFKDGQVKAQHNGACSKAELENLIQKNI